MHHPLRSRGPWLATLALIAPGFAILAAGCTYELDPIVRPGVVTLSFEGGPNPGTTEAILDVLDEHRVRAFFCVTGADIRRSAVHADLVREIDRRGHLLVNHGDSGVETWTLGTPYGVREEVVDCDQAMSAALRRPEPTRFFRPVGTYLAVQRGGWQGLTKSLLLADTRYGDLSMGPEDAETLVAAITADMDAGTAGLIALHDGVVGQPENERLFVAEVVDRILDHAEANGLPIGQATLRQRVTAPTYDESTASR